ncbi:Hypothetical predicted protein, partial [Mytilus galloprovincialis]
SGHVVDGTDFVNDKVWFGSASSVTSTFLHLANSEGPPCPDQAISMINDPGWLKLQQIGFKDPSGQQWPLTHRQENIQNLVYDNAISIKLARDVNKKEMYTGAYIRSAEFENGGTYEVTIKAANGKGIPVTGIMLWDGPEDGIATYDYITEDDWTLHLCDCCLEDPVAETCSFCNCSGTDIISTTLPSVTTSKTPYAIVKSPDETVVTKPVDMAIPVAQTACGVQILTGDVPQVGTWCQAYNNTQRLMKAQVDLSFDPTANYHRYKVVVTPLKDDEVNINWCIKVYADEEELTEICGIEPPSTSAKLVLHVWNRNNYVPDISDLFNVFSAKAYFKDLIIPPKIGNKCRYGDPFRGGTNPVIKYEAGIGTEKLQTDIVPYREIYRPCIPCNTQCSLSNCHSDCDINQQTLVTFNLSNLALEPFTLAENDTGHMYNKSAIYYTTVRVLLGNGLTTEGSSDGFYIDITPPVFDTDVMNGQIYVDVTQGEFTPVKYQASSDTIKAYWYCYDDESLIKDNLWAIGTIVGGEEIQPFTSLGLRQIGINSSLEGVLQSNQTYYVSIICQNGAGQITQWNDKTGVIALLEPPDVQVINTTLVGAEDFNGPVTPSDSKRGTDPETIGFSFTPSEDKRVTRYDICIGTSEHNDDIFPCTYISVNMSGTVLIKNGSIYMNEYKLYDLHELRKDQSSSSSNTFHMEPGRTLFITLRACNDAYLCSNKSLGTVTMMDDKAVMKTSVGGEPLEVEYDMSSNKRKRRSVGDTLVINTYGLASGQSILMEPLDSSDLTTVYDSVSSAEFQPYIVNPNDTMDLVDRLLYRRLSTSIFSFTLVPIGHLPMPGPVNITYFDTSSDEDHRIMLTHWNPVEQQWELTSETCADHGDKETTNSDGSTSILVCRTWISKNDNSTNSRKKRSIEETEFFTQETQFSLSIVSTSIYNTPPELISPDAIMMEEDSGTLQYLLEATDDEDDTILFYLEDSTYSMGTPSLTTDGMLLYTPCTDCAGTEYIHILLTEHQTDIPAASSNVTITVDVISQNDHPVVFLTQFGSSILLEDTSEPVVIYLEQMTNHTGHILSDQFSAVFGGHDIDVQDSLIVISSQPEHGIVKLSNEQIVPPEIGPCSQTIAMDSEPCGNFSHTLPYRASDMLWIYTKVTYFQPADYYGYDYLRMYIIDDKNGTSEVVTVQFTIMESPCQNKGVCKGKDTSNYPCKDTHRAESFDLYYNCECPPEFTGQHCEEDVDECLSKPCPDSYTCTNTIGGYACSCPDCGLSTGIKAMIGLVVVLVVINLIVIIAFYIRKKKRPNEVSADKAIFWSMPITQLDARPDPEELMFTEAEQNLVL